MNYYMLTIDSIVIVVLANFLMATYRFHRQAKKNLGTHDGDYIAQMHFAEHATAAYFAMIGSSIGVCTAFAHTLIQNVLKVPLPVWIEYATSAAATALIISGWLFMLHMQKEETPGHPFYVREYGGDK